MLRNRVWFYRPDLLKTKIKQDIDEDLLVDCHGKKFSDVVANENEQIAKQEEHRNELLKKIEELRIKRQSSKMEVPYE